MRAAARVLLVLLILAPGLAAEDKDEKATKKADAELQKLVNQAIDRGAEWLARQQAGDGSFPSRYSSSYPMGATALSVLALLHSGAPRTSVVIKRAFDYLRTTYAEQKSGRGARGGRDGRRRGWRGILGLRTYSVSVTIMALAEYGRTRERVSKANEHYGGGVAKGFQLEQPDLDWMREMVNWLVSVQASSGAWRYPEGGYDHSNSQYALLALKEARRVGLRVPERVFSRALEHFVKAQERNGTKVPRFEEEGGDGVYAAGRYRTRGYDRARGWGYLENAASTGSMTAAGVAAVAICASELEEKSHKRLLVKGEQSRRDGLAWLGKSFSVRDNPGMGPSWHYYYLYGLERAGVLSGVVWMGERRWYAEGARYLVDSQRPDGALASGGGMRRAGGRARGNVVDHCFALLFLARATARALGTVTEQPHIDLTGALDLPDREAKDLFRAASKEMEKLSGEKARDRARDFAFFGPRVIGWLLPLLYGEEESSRARGILILRAVTSRTFEYDPAAKPEEREAAADRWTAWYLASRAKLTFDRGARLIR